MAEEIKPLIVALDTNVFDNANYFYSGLDLGILMQASLTYKDKRFEGYDCACIAEVIEPARIPAFERSVFEFASPRTVIVTTPNREYNANYEKMKENDLRHGDHRFEWTRAQFKEWTVHICERFGYTCEISGIGDEDGQFEFGQPTQMGVFRKNG